MPESEQVLPKYLQIAGHIRDQIIRGDLKAGDDVPSERELATTWGVARPTATKALEALRNQGFVASRKGAGTFVLGPEAAPRARERYARARELGTMYSSGESVEFLSTALAVGPEHVLEALRLPAYSSAIQRTRLIRGESGRPIELSTSWYTPNLAQLAPRLLEPERILGGTARYLSELTGRETAYARDQVAARHATEQESAVLELAPRSPVLAYRLTIYDSSDQPIQFDDATYPPGLWAFRQEYPLEQ